MNTLLLKGISLAAVLLFASSNGFSQTSSLNNNREKNTDKPGKWVSESQNQNTVLDEESKFSGKINSNPFNNWWSQANPDFDTQY